MEPAVSAAAEPQLEGGPINRINVSPAGGSLNAAALIDPVVLPSRRSRSMSEALTEAPVLPSLPDSGSALVMDWSDSTAPAAPITAPVAPAAPAASPAPADSPVKGVAEGAAEAARTARRAALVASSTSHAHMLMPGGGAGAASTELLEPAPAALQLQLQQEQRPSGADRRPGTSPELNLPSARRRERARSGARET